MFVAQINTFLQQNPTDSSWVFPCMTNQMKQNNFFHPTAEKVFARSRNVNVFAFLQAWCFRAAHMAESNASFRFFWVSAEHSTYPCAFIFLASDSACERTTGFTLIWSRSMRILTLYLRSDCVPTKTIGQVGLNARTWGIHLEAMLWNDTGLTTLKHRMKTSTCPYHMDRKLSNSS